MINKGRKIENDFEKLKYLEWLMQGHEKPKCECSHDCGKPIIYDFTKDLSIDKKQTEEIEEANEKLDIIDNIKLPVLEHQIEEIT